MAISTQGVILNGCGIGSVEKVIDIKDFPDLGGATELLETTPFPMRLRPPSTD
jgi:hypothetical protein